MLAINNCTRVNSRRGKRRLAMNSNNLFLAFGILSIVATFSVGTGVEVVTDDKLDEIIAQNEFVLALFQKDPCVSEDCEGALYETSVVSNTSYIPGLKVVRLVNSELHAKYSLGIRSRLIFYRSSVPILFDSDLIRMDDVVVWLEQNKEQNSRYLDTNSFEHLTQASTGATTGDWFILFHKRRCNHIFPLWESVASHLQHKINIAVVDTGESPELKTRFRINKCPTIIYFRLGRMYMYELPTQELKPFLQFADGWYVNAPSSEVPRDPTPFDVLTDSVVTWLKAFRVHEACCLTSFIIALTLLVLVVGCVCFMRRHPHDAHEKSKSN